MYRKKLSKESPHATESVTSELYPLTPPSSQATESDLLFSHGPEAVSSLNVCLAEIGETPFSQSRAQSKTYCGQKVKKMALQHTVITGAPTNDGTEMIQQLKEKFRETKRRSEQVQVLTVLPKSWSVKKVQQELGVSEYLATVKEAGRGKRHSFSSWSITRTEPPETVINVCSFYESDDISRVMPGKKDFISVKKEGKREHIQKRLVLSDLRGCTMSSRRDFWIAKLGFQNLLN